MEGFEDRIAACPDHRGHEENGPHGRPSATNEALAAPAPGLACPGRQSGQACDLAAGELSEFGHFGQQRAGNDVAHAGDALEQFFLLTPYRRAADGVIDTAVENGELLLQGFDETGGAPSEIAGRRSATII